jgi:dTMP kinase
MYKFLAIEGIDGSGKSTQVEALKKYFTKNNISYEYIHFPQTSAPYFGELIARFLRGDFGKINDVDPYIVALLYAGDRDYMKNKIREWLKTKLVLVDRYVLSNMAFQCAKIASFEEKSKLREWIRSLEYEYFQIPEPDLSIFLDVPFDFATKNLLNSRVGPDRDYLNGKKDIHEENFDFQKAVKNEYLYLLENENNFISVKCTDSNGLILNPDEIQNKIIEVCKKFKIISNESTK